MPDEDAPLSGMPPGDDSRSWQAPSGFPWPPIVLIGVAVLVSAVVIGYQVTRPAPSGPRVVTDQAFVAEANRACSSALPALRPQDTRRESISTPQQVADQSVAAADGLAALAQRLRSIPVAAEQETFIEGWLDGWGTFVDAGRRYAQAVRSGDVEAANDVARSGDPAQRQADAFARGNGIDSCLLQSAIRKPRSGASGA